MPPYKKTYNLTPWIQEHSGPTTLLCLRLTILPNTMQQGPMCQPVQTLLKDIEINISKSHFKAYGIEYYFPYE